jgi:hypothetical protein
MSVKVASLESQVENTWPILFAPLSSEIQYSKIAEQPKLTSKTLTSIELVIPVNVIVLVLKKDEFKFKVLLVIS